MITDVFHKRYEHYLWFGDYRSNGSIVAHRFFIQICHVLEDLNKALSNDSIERIYTGAHDKLVRELGWGRLHKENNIVERCFSFLAEPYDLWNNSHGDFNTYNAIRLSLIELLFREHEAEVLRSPTEKKALIKPRSLVQLQNTSHVEALQAGIQELNHRMQENNLNLHYHSGVIQISGDAVTTAQVIEPFWEITKDEKWKNVDREMKEAIDHKDSGATDAHFHAMKALESTIKIISDSNGLTTGKERGAANYIDNLLGAKIIKTWEAEMLKFFFKEVRNPAGHGTGSQPLNIIPPYEVTLIIESAMSSIKSLIRRS